MYARATMQLTDYYNIGDRWLKFGLTLFDGDSIINGTQYMFYVDAFVNRDESANDIDRIVGDGFGEVKRVNGGYQTWTTIDSSYKFNLQTFKVTMELIYDNGVVYFIADGNLIAQRNYRGSGRNLYMGIKNFGLGMEVSNYYCTTDKNDANIHTNLFQKGKALYYFLGSSVTYGSANGGKSFVELLPSKLDCSVVKSAVSGTTLVNGNGSYVDRLKSQLPIGQSVEHLVVQLSTNDATQGKPIGKLSNGNYDTTTVIGAIEEIIDYAKKTWGCEVTFYTNPYYDNDNYETMIDALYQVQGKWGIGIVDFYNYRDMDSLDQATLSSYMADAIHPNQKGYEWMAGVFANYLANRYALNHHGDSIIK